MPAGSRRPLARWLVSGLWIAAVTVAAAGAVALNLPVSPPTGITSPIGTAAAPNIVARTTGNVVRPSGGAAAAGAPAQAVDFLTPELGWDIVGCGGPHPCQVRRTEDHGLSWQTVWTTRARLTGLAFVTSRDGFAWTGTGGCTPGARCPTRLFASSDGGISWRLRFEGGATPWTHVVATSAASLWVTVGGELLHSADGGRVWRLVPTPTCIPLTVTFRGRQGVVAGDAAEGACALASADGGETWRTLLPGLDAKAIAPAFRAFVDASGLAEAVGGPVGARGMCTGASAQATGGQEYWLVVRCDRINPNMLAVFRTTDGGRTWRLVWGADGCDAACQAAGDGEAPVLIEPGRVWRQAPHGLAVSTDGGRTFRAAGSLCPTARCPVTDLQFVSGDDGFAATSQGVYATLTGGASWQRVWPATGPGPLETISYPTPAVGLAVAVIAPGTVLRTTTGGRSWQAQFTLAGAHIRLLDFLSARQGFVYGTRGGRGELWVTTDGGRRLRRLSVPHGPPGKVRLVRLSFFSPRLGIALDAFGDVWRTEDGGAHWSLVPALPLGAPQAVAWQDAHTVFAAVRLKVRGGHAGIVVSRDGGQSWSPYAAWPLSASGASALPTVLAARGSELWTFAYGGLLRSANGGVTWTEVRFRAPEPSATALQFPSPEDGWLLSQSGSLYTTADGGSTWRRVPGT